MSVLVFDLNLKQFCNIPGIFLFEKHFGIEFLENEYGHAAVFFWPVYFYFSKASVFSFRYDHEFQFGFIL